MIANTKDPSNFLDGIKQFQKSMNSSSPHWLKEWRERGLCGLSTLGLPSVKDEEWKYTNIAPLLKRQFGIAAACEIREQDSFDQFCDSNDIQIVFVNGTFIARLSNLSALPQGVEILTLHQAILNREETIKEILEEFDAIQNSAFAALNLGLLNEGCLISIDKNIQCNQLIHIIHLTSAPGRDIMISPRTFIKVGMSSEVSIQESHLSFDDELIYFANPLTDIDLKPNATLHYSKAQRESHKAFHIGTTRVYQERDSHFDGFSLMIGGLITRNNLDVNLNGEGISSTLNGLYMIGHDQHTDNHTSVVHRQPNCTSNQLYKGILNDHSRAVFNGKIFVNDIAQLTNSYQLNKNLLLGKGCKVDTKPQLEIFADDVKCTHGATIGQLNKDELFYLQARGIARNLAVKMLARGFIEDILESITHPSMNKKLHHLIKPAFAKMKDINPS